MKFLTSATVVSLILAAQNVMAMNPVPGGGSKVPEPGVWALLGIGAAVFVARRFMKR